MTAVEINGKLYSEQDIVNEKEEYVRLEAVDRCFALNLLVNDKSPLIRSAVARKKIGHDQLVNDPDWKVRATVAMYCRESLLDSLKDDPSDFVRFVVVKRGYDLKRFIDDQDDEIASIARYQLQNSALA